MRFLEKVRVVSHAKQFVSVVFTHAPDMEDEGEIDAFPKLLTAVSPAIHTAIERGVSVLIQAYSPISIKNAHIAQAYMS
ncbi:MAG: hypothetical protein AAF614_20095, partial [Chloroflexota bacterium]